MSPLLPLASLLLGFGVCSIDGVEYCLTETFHARCRQRNEVILMETARFGRMELGRCVTRNFGHVGCAADVISQLDAACSGRTYCDLSVSDPSLVRMKPCPKDFSAYLDALYHCVAVITSSMDECRVRGEQVVATDNGYISNSITTSSIPRHAGHNNLAVSSTPEDGLTTPCPFVFNLDPGQRLTLTLFDFALRNTTGQLFHGSLPPSSASSSSAAATGWDRSADSESSELCLRYLVIDEPTIASSVTICGGSGRHGSSQQVAGAAMTSSPMRRERHVYTSRSTSVHMHLLAPSAARFLVKFQVTGCSNPPWLPADSHAKYHIDRLVIVCNYSSESFVLICIQENGRNQWIGELKNCTKTPAMVANSHDLTQPDSFGMPHIGWSLAIVVGVAMVTVIYVAVVITCLLHIRRWRHRVPASPQSKLVGSKAEMTSSLSDATTLVTERTAMVGVKQTVYQTDGGMTYSELFQLKPASSPSSSTAILHRSLQRDVQYMSPARLSASSVPEQTLTSATASRVTYYDSPYGCAWCYDDVAPSRKCCRQTATTTELQYHESLEPPSSRCLDRDGNAIGELPEEHERRASNGRSSPSNGNYSANNGWLERSVGQSRDTVMTSSANRQREIILLGDENDMNASGATSPDVIISASTCAAT